MPAASDANVPVADGQAPSLCAFERVRVIALRAAQLMQGCTSRLPASHRATVTARHEVEAGLIRALPVPEGAESATPARGQHR